MKRPLNRPLALIVGLLSLVLVVNAVFIYIAVTHRDTVVESYELEER